MKIVLFVILVITLLIFGEWLYRMFLRPVDPLGVEVLALSDFFNENEIPGEPYPVRHSFRYSYLLSASAYKIENYPLPVVIGVHPSVDVARSSAGRNNVHSAISNENIVISFPAWGEDTGPMKEKVKHVFGLFAK